MRCNEERLNYWHILAPIAVATIFFGVSVILRYPWFGLYPDINSSSTADYCTSAFARNLDSWIHWTDESMPLFRLTSLPCTAETPNLVDRYMHTYTPVSVWPVYFTALIFPTVAKMKLFMGFNLFYHWLVTALLGATLWMLLRRARLAFVPALALITGALAVVTFSPAPMKFFLISYVPDTAVLPLAMLFILLEVVADGLDENASRALRTISVAQGLLIFVGALAEYLFYPLVLATFFKRLWLGQITGGFRKFFRHAFLLFLPLAFAFTAFIGYLAALQSLPYALLKMLIYSFVIKGPWPLTLWHDHIAFALGSHGLLLIQCSLAVGATLVLAGIAKNRFHRHVPAPWEILVSGMILLACPAMLHSFLLATHSCENSYSCLKHVLWLGPVLFCLIPGVGLVALAHVDRARRYPRLPAVATAVVLAIAAAFLVRIAPARVTLFGEPSTRLTDLAVALNPRLADRDFVVVASDTGHAINWNLCALIHRMPWFLQDPNQLPLYTDYLEKGLPPVRVLSLDDTARFQAKGWLPPSTRACNPPDTVKVLAFANTPLVAEQITARLLNQAIKQEPLPNAILYTVRKEDFIQYARDRREAK